MECGGVRESGRVAQPTLPGAQMALTSTANTLSLLSGCCPLPPYCVYNLISAVFVCVT